MNIILFGLSVFVGWVGAILMVEAGYLLIHDWREWIRIQQRLDFYVGGATWKSALA